MVPSARERLMNSTIALVRQRGVAGTGITELLAHSNTARRTVYLNFPGGKAQLVEEATRLAGCVMSSVIADLAAAKDPIDAFVELWKDTLVSGDFTDGCPVVAAALAGPEAPAAPAAAAEAFADWANLICAQLGRVGVDPDVARSLATTAVAAVEGAVVMAVASRSVRPLDDVGHHLRELVRLHLP